MIVAHSNQARYSLHQPEVKLQALLGIELGTNMHMMPFKSWKLILVPDGFMEEEQKDTWWNPHLKIWNVQFYRRSSDGVADFLALLAMDPYPISYSKTTER